MNERNLKRGNPSTQFRTGREQVETAKKGGIASGKSRALKSIANRVLKQMPPKDIAAKLKKSGYSAEDIKEAMVYVMAMLALEGDVQAYDRLIQAAGEDIRHEELALKKQELKLKEKETDRKNGTGKTSGNDPLTASLRELAKELDENGDQ